MLNHFIPSALKFIKYVIFLINENKKNKTELKILVLKLYKVIAFKKYEMKMRGFFSSKHIICVVHDQVLFYYEL